MILQNIGERFIFFVEKITLSDGNRRFYHFLLPLGCRASMSYAFHITLMRAKYFSRIIFLDFFSRK
jgi:hypothetical protein